MVFAHSKSLMESPHIIDCDKSIFGYFSIACKIKPILGLQHLQESVLE